jgi:putative Mn2+ efflux pump MntP
MKTWEILLIAVSLAMDAVAVAVAAGASGYGERLRPAVRLAFHFGLFQFLMPVIGWWIGFGFARRIEQYDHWVAFMLLAGVGTHMLWEAFHPETEAPLSDPTRGMRMVALSVATSLDALAVGMSLAMVGVTIWYPSAVIGLVTGTLALVGIQLGNRLRGRFGRSLDVVGGLILIALGGRILWEHLRY